MITTAHSSAHPWRRRTDALAVILFAGLAGYAAVLLWQTAQTIGITIAEAQALESALAVPPSARAYLQRMFVAAPLAEWLLRLAHTHLTTLWQARGLFWLVNTLNLMLLVLIARRASTAPLTMWWALALAGASAQWWLRGQQMGPVVMTTFAALLVQWAWHRAYARLHWRNMLTYGAVSVVALSASPYVACLLLLHAVTWATALMRTRSPMNEPSSAPSRPALITLLQLTLLLLALLVAFNKSIQLRLPTWIIDPTWWRDVVRCFWTVLCAASGSSYIGLPLLPGHAVWKDLAFPYVVTWALGALTLLACMRRRRDARTTAWIWGVTFFILPFLWTLLTGRSPRMDESTFVAMSWPYVILLSADSCAWLTLQLMELGVRTSRRATRYALLATTGALAGALWLTWFHLQRAAYDVALYDLGDHDLAAPAHFLAHMCQPADRVVLVSTSDPQCDPHLRWYLAPVRDTLRVAATVTASPSRVAAVLPALAPAPADSGALWVVQHHLDPLAVASLGLTNVSLLFAVRVEHLCATEQATAGYLGHLYRRAAALAPYAGRIQRQLCEWYKTADDYQLQDLVRSGQAQQDLAGVRPLRWRPYQRAAANAVLYAWARQYPHACAAPLYPPFDQFVSAVGPDLLDHERVIFLYRQHIEQALSVTNLPLANAALCAARRWDSNNPYLDRLAAQVCLLEDPTHLGRARRLNARAARTHERRYGRPFIEALFANMILDKQQRQTPRAIRSCMTILKLVQHDAFIPHAVRTNTAPEADEQRAAWQRQRLFWEAQCHSYLALLLLSTGDYQNAVNWLSRNLAPRFDEVRRMAAYEQLARLYSESGDLPRALRHFETLATLATSPAQRVHWLIQAAQLHVTAGDTVAAHETWQQILELADTLDNTARRALVRNKQYQRLAQYIARRMNVDGRDTVILTLQARAHDTPHRAAWCYRQIAQIERARLRYDAADAFFERAMQAVPLDPEAYLDAALYYYRRLQYHRSATIFSNLLVRLSGPLQEVLQRTDWRFALLHTFYTRGEPTPEASAFAWLAAAATNFVEPAAYDNARGHLLAWYDHFHEATNAFTHGIATNAYWLDNYLDLGYLLATRGESEATAAILDQLDALPGVSHQLRGDWRHVILHHVSVRPYLPDKEADED